MSSDSKVPTTCPSCGAEGSLSAQGREFVCSDGACGRAFPINPKQGLEAPPKRKAATKKK